MGNVNGDKTTGQKTRVDVLTPSRVLVDEFGGVAGAKVDARRVDFVAAHSRETVICGDEEIGVLDQFVPRILRIIRGLQVGQHLGEVVVGIFYGCLGGGAVDADTDLIR